MPEKRPYSTLLGRLPVPERMPTANFSTLPAPAASSSHWFSASNHLMQSHQP